MTVVVCRVLAAAISLASPIMLLGGVDAQVQTAVPVTQLDRETTLSTFAGHLVWSARDAVSGGYRLMDAFHGAIRPLPVAERTVPFDVGLGPGPDGRPLAVYSRCAKEPADLDFDGLPRWADATGCKLRVYSFATRRERGLPGQASSGRSGFLPSVWRRRIAFFRAPPAATPARGVPVPGLRLGRLDGRGDARTLPVGDGPISPSPHVRLRLLTPSALHLVGHHLVLGLQWSGTSAAQGGHGTTDIRLLNVDPRQARRPSLIASGVVGEGCLHILVSPVIDHDTITMVKRDTCFGSSIKRYQISTGRRFSAKISGDPVAMARSATYASDAVALLATPRYKLLRAGDTCAPAYATLPNETMPDATPCDLLRTSRLVFTPERLRGPLPEPRG
jgi:hypothetical protein